jgi:hypothetical protein
LNSTKPSGRQQFNLNDGVTKIVKYFVINYKVPSVDQRRFSRRFRSNKSRTKPSKRYSNSISSSDRITAFTAIFIVI